jgi:predicted ATP-dependent endonuclease of OLD family
LDLAARSKRRGDSKLGLLSDEAGIAQQNHRLAKKRKKRTLKFVTVGDMRLIEAELSGYKRFAAENRMDLDGDLICIVGPNASGKSSFLNALVHFNTDNDFNETERTRAEQGQTLPPALRITFELEKGDREALSEFPEAANAKRLFVFKRDDGGDRTYRIDPRPERDLDQRRALRAHLEEFQNSPWLEKHGEPGEEEAGEPAETRTSALLNEAIEIADLDLETLEGASLDSLTALQGRLQEIVAGDRLADAQEDIPQKYQGLPDELERLIESERINSPHRRAIAALTPRVPLFLKFDDAARDLGARYDLNAAPDDAITNLLSLAGIDWEGLGEVANSDNRGWRLTFIDQANKKLEAEITEAWGQLPLTVRLSLEGTELTVVMEMEAEDYIEIDQQSDGLRQFVALRSFIASQAGDVSPIVLIDEAETHLHYDAQAEVVTVFEEQNEAAQIIYTTHSAGCLPRDIGVGLRGITPTTALVDGKERPTDHSQIVNEFWLRDYGFSPVLIAMGAGAFAFSSVSKAVMTEGFTDALLLPSLFREALGQPRLGYQVVPRFAGVAPGEIPNFDLVAARLAVLADGDAGGADHKKTLQKQGLSNEQIFFLGGPGSGLSLEDLIDEEIYRQAVNDELKEHKPDLRFTDPLPNKGRSKTVERWAANEKSSDGQAIKLSKAAVAQRVLNQRKKDGKKKRLLSADHKQTLKDLDTEIKDFLKKARKK